MTSNSSGAVFFLGTRAHYHVLQRPESKSYDVENGNALTETIYQNPSVREVWPKAATVETSMEENHNWNYYENTKITITDETQNSKIGVGVKRRNVLRQSETILCEREELRPALLNTVNEGSPQKTKPARRKSSIFGFLTSLLRRRQELDSTEDEEIQYLQHLDNCSYSDSCRCLDCQARYFECDDEDYSSDDDDYSTQYAVASIAAQDYVQECAQGYAQEFALDADDEDDEVFVSTAPGDNTSTDMLLDGNELATMSISSDDVTEEDGYLNLEVAAGTPVFLNYLLNHPFTCNVQ